VGGLEESVLVGGVFVGDGQVSLPPSDELVAKDVGLIVGLQDERLGRTPFGDGDVTGASDGLDRDLPGALFLIASLVPGRTGSGQGTTVSLIGSTGKVLEISADHTLKRYLSGTEDR
jgi:hypothetical protein